MDFSYTDLPGKQTRNIKIGGEQYEINISLSLLESHKIASFISGNDKTRLYAGLACNYKACWSLEGDLNDLFILVGSDVESWEICVVVPRKEITRLAQVLQNDFNE